MSQCFLVSRTVIYSPWTLYPLSPYFCFPCLDPDCRNYGGIPCSASSSELNENDQEIIQCMRIHPPSSSSLVSTSLLLPRLPLMFRPPIRIPPPPLLNLHTRLFTKTRNIYLTCFRMKGRGGVFNGNEYLTQI